VHNIFIDAGLPLPNLDGIPIPPKTVAKELSVDSNELNNLSSSRKVLAFYSNVDRPSGNTTAVLYTLVAQWICFVTLTA